MLNLLFSSILWGFVTGTLSGIFGIGGSIISTPALRLAMQTTAEIALGTPLPVIIPTAVTAGINFYKAGLIDKRLIIYALPFGIIGSMVGSFSTKYIDAKYLMIVTAFLLIFFGVNFIKTSNLEFVTKFSIKRTFFIGYVAGFVSGLLGVGGGIILIPGFHLLMGMPIKVAMGSSLIIIALMAIPGSIVHYLLGHIDIVIFLGLCIGVIPGSRLGSKMSINIRSKLLKMTFGVFLVTIGIIFIIFELKEFGVLHIRCF